MLVALSRDGRAIISQEATSALAPFVCPECLEPVVPHRGPHITWHFSHRPGARCQHGENESVAHLYAKRQIYEALRQAPGVTQCHVEHKIGKLRADVYFQIGVIPVAIEIQLSDVAIETIKAKLECYTAAGVVTLYLVRDIAGGTYCPPQWTRYLHAMYRQNLYTWFEGTRVTMSHLGRYVSNPWEIGTREFYLQKRPVFRYRAPISLLSFGVAQRHHSECINRHVGITDALLWQQPCGEWWASQLHRDEVLRYRARANY